MMERRGSNGKSEVNVYYHNVCSIALRLDAHALHVQ